MTNILTNNDITITQFVGIREKNNKLFLNFATTTKEVVSLDIEEAVADNEQLINFLVKSQESNNISQYQIMCNALETLNSAKTESLLEQNCEFWNKRRKFKTKYSICLSARNTTT